MKGPMPESGSRGAKRLAKGNRRIPIQTIILRTLYATGAIGTALVAPHALQYFPSPDRGKRRRRDLYARIDQALYRLRARGLISFTATKGSRPIASLTGLGKAEITKLVLGNYKIPETTIWDGRWRVIIFDIREKRRRVRAQLRRLLKGAGMVRVQDSVWVYPYPCDEFIALVRAHLASGVGELRSFVAEALESDRELRTHFRLP